MAEYVWMTSNIHCFIQYAVCNVTFLVYSLYLKLLCKPTLATASETLIIIKWFCCWGRTTPSSSGSTSCNNLFAIV